jgi:hypothetical protein
MATKSELSVKVMQYLGRLQAGQTINSDDSTLIQDAYDSLYLNLQDNHSVNWGPDDEIPQQFEIQVTMLLANQSPVCKAFGVPVDHNDLSIAQRTLKQSLAIDDNYEPARVNNF